MTNPTIHYAQDAQGIVTLTLDYPGKSMNVIDQSLMDDLRDCIARVAADPAVIGAIVTSGKQAFVAGADLLSMEANLDSMRDDSMQVLFDKCASLSRLLRQMETCGKPFVAAINGTAMGGGLEICLACHYRVVSDAPGLLLGLPEVQVGLLPGAGGTQRMLRILGISRAMPYLLEGKHFDAAKGLKEGIVQAIASPDSLLDTARRWLLDQPTAIQPWDIKGYTLPGGGPFDAKVAPSFVVGNTMLQAQTFHNLPAPLAIQSCLYEGAQLPMDKALRVESKYLAYLTRDPVSRGMIRTLFVSKTKAEKGLHRPAGIAPLHCRTLGIVGAGMMGSGIAQMAAQRGIDVVLLDRDAAAAERGKEAAQKRLARLVEKGRMEAGKAQALLARLRTTADYADLAASDVVIEAVFENRAIKADILRQLDAVLPAHCLVASNTSSLPITLLAQAGAHPERFIGMHFFSPAERMPLVEVIRGRVTSDQSLAHALDLVAQLRKTPIVVNDHRGFFTSRFIGSFVDDGIAMLAEGVAPALIENCARQAGMPVGPLAITDEMSIELSKQAGDAQAREFPDSYRPGRSVPVIEKLFALGRMGRKNGKGFYDYDDKGKSLWPGLADHYPLRTEQPQPQDLRQRVLYVQAIEAARAMEDGVLLSPADGDVGAILGVGFPAYTGGPFSFMDGIGIAEFVREAERLAALFGPHLQPPALLKRMAAEGATFYGPRALRLP
jgi:3-hydroxyacyl-CoA dehydrogenase/enoyl-CoA hydratase/3-hydroxybutyryl-CoA epimerase